MICLFAYCNVRVCCNVERMTQIEANLKQHTQCYYCEANMLYCLFNVTCLVSIHNNVKLTHIVTKSSLTTLECSQSLADPMQFFYFYGLCLHS